MSRRWPIVLGLLALVVIVAVALVLLWRLNAGLAPGGERAPVTGSPVALGRGPSPSAIGAWYEVAFTTPAIPDRPANRRGGIEDRLIGLMDRAQRTLDVAVYEFDLENVADAMARAARRGVRVRLVTDTDTLESRDAADQAVIATLRAANIPIVPDSRRPIMHNKFTVVDGEWVETGSWNYTVNDTYRNNNNQIIIQSRELAANYTAEFDKMFTARQFGGAKPPGVPSPTLSIAGARVENYFSPEDRPGAHVIRWVSGARQRIHFLAFSFTHDGIGDAMLDRARAGVEVAGVFETTGSDTRFSEYNRFKSAGLDVLLDGNPRNMHHKVIIVDDRVTIFGSFNFSSNADRDNDENLLIVEDPGLAGAFEAEYQRVRAVAASPRR
jgi:phosphatidylserine/phosphatidylglycerophosphate/cardiolipin synthase-like enzyme